MVDDNTPIIVGVAELVERIDGSKNSRFSSQIDLAVEVLTQALADCGLDAEQIDVLANLRTMDDCLPTIEQPFGRSDNPCGMIAQRVGARPKQLIFTSGGGHTPQKLVNKWAESLSQGKAEVVVLVGAEAKANENFAKRNGIALDWSESVPGEFEDQGLGLDGMLQVEGIRHGLFNPTSNYALCENAYRGELGVGVADHQRAMAELFAPFSAIAAANPNAMFPVSYSAAEIAEVSAANPYIDFPYTKRMVAKDGVNQAAAVVMTTAGRATQLGIDQSQWVYLHAYAEAEDRPLLHRESLARSKAMSLAYQQLLESFAGEVEDIAYFDLYSCFPIAVSLAKRELGLAADQCLTLTGGLPFFGGPGNNYSMHAIASMVRQLRKDPASYGLIGANGGMLSKHAVGIYSCVPGWQVCDSSAIRKAALEQDAPHLDSSPEGEASIESYTVSFMQGKPVNAVVVGRLADNGNRFVAVVPRENTALFNKLLTQECLGSNIYVTCPPRGNTVFASRAEAAQWLPKQPSQFKSSYKYCDIAINGRVLEITINRPEAMNSLHPMANEELAEIFDIYCAEPNLWVAIITGAGDQAFCAGNDLKYSASGKPMWVPKSGFAGITSRVGRVKPVIAAVNGVAMGGGMEIALACDVAIADESAVFSLPEVKRGLIAAGGGIIRLTRDIPKKVAIDILLTGRDISANEAKQLGFITQVTTTGGALAAAREYAKLLCANSPSSVQLTLELINEKIGVNDPAEAAKFEAKTFDKLITSSDFYEGPKAFAQKRKPNWKAG